MQKTTVYIPEELKAALARVARETRRSEAEIIREGIELAVARGKAPQPRSGIFRSGDPHLSERVDELLEGFGRA